MPKALCYTGMATAILIALLFTFDLAAPASMAPFRKASVVMDVSLIVAGLMLGVASFMTLREQR